MKLIFYNAVMQTFHCVIDYVVNISDLDGNACQEKVEDGRRHQPFNVQKKFSIHST